MMPTLVLDPSTISSRYVRLVHDGRSPSASFDDAGPTIRGGRRRVDLGRPERLIGQVVGDRYRVVSILGQGGMGVVYEAVHVHLRSNVALKVLMTDDTSGLSLLGRFFREAHAGAVLDSPHVARVFDCGLDAGFAYLAMELAPGRTLSALVRDRGSLGSLRVAQIGRQVCMALHEAHRRGIIHRDIKPDNVMVSASPDGDRVKLLDFGLAKMEEDISSVETTRGVVLGTPFYMAPEQIRGDAVSPRTDLYSLGAAMYRALTGLHAFDGTAADVMSKHLTARPVPPDERVPMLDIDPELSLVIQRAMARHPSDRFASAADLGEALARVATRLSSSGREPSVDDFALPSFWSKVRRTLAAML